MKCSQIAEAFYNHMTKSSDAMSAGATAEIKHHISKRAIEAMGEIGIDMRHLRPLQLTQVMLDTVDKIIYFPSDYMPEYVKQNPKSELWDVVDPHYHKEEGMDLVRSVRDTIEVKVEALIVDENHSDR